MSSGSELLSVAKPTPASADPGHVVPSPKGPDIGGGRGGAPDPRMEAFGEQERDFLQFVAETQSINDVQEEPDRPLTGLQCLLALTEILDRAARLRRINFDLEQRIEDLDKAKLHAELKNHVCQMTALAENSQNGGAAAAAKKKNPSRQASMISPSDEGYRTLSIHKAGSSESLDMTDSLSGSATYRPDSDDAKSRSLKGSILSETWGRMKGKLTSKELAPNRVAKRHKSADLASSLPHALSTAPAAVETSTSHYTLTATSSSSVHASGGTTAVTTSVTASQFTQREVVISPSADDLVADFGGVWLGDESADADADAAATNDSVAAVDAGGLYLGPPDNATSTQSKEVDQSTAADSKEKTRKSSNEPAKSSAKPVGRSGQHGSADGGEELKLFPGKLINALTGSRRKVSVFSRPEGFEQMLSSTSTYVEPAAAETPNKSPVMRKKLMTKSPIKLSVSADSKSKRKSDTNSVSKEFIKKMEEWNQMKEQSKQHEAGKTEEERKGKQTKDSKTKTQRFKNRKRADLWKNRSKSAERAEAQQRLSNEFEEKLREWSVKQGYKPTYYTDLQASQGSSDNVDGQFGQKSRQDSQSQDVSDGEVFDIKEARNLSSGDSASSLPANTELNDSQQNLKALQDISQSADTVFVNKTKLLAMRKLSRSAETISKVSSTARLALQQPSIVKTEKLSHIDLYAKASDESLVDQPSLSQVMTGSVFKVRASTVIPVSRMEHRPDHKRSATADGESERRLERPASMPSDGLFRYQTASGQVSSSSDECMSRDSGTATDLMCYRATDKQQPETSSSEDLLSCNPTQMKDRYDEDALIHKAMKDLENVLEKEEGSLTTTAASPRRLRRQSQLSQSPSPTLSDLSSDGDLSDDKNFSPLRATHAKPLDSLYTRPLFNVSKIKKTSLDSMLKPAVFSLARENRQSDVIDGTTPQRSTNSDLYEPGGKVVRGKPPLSPRTSCHAIYGKGEGGSGPTVPTANQTVRPVSDQESSCDINSNDVNAASHNVESHDAGTDSIYLGTNVPLKLRLKSLAKEYEMEEEKRNTVSSISVSKSQSTDGTAPSVRPSHKRTRSHDCVPSFSLNSYLPKQPVAGSYLSSSKPRPSSMHLEEPPPGSAHTEPYYPQPRDRCQSAASSRRLDPAHPIHRMRSLDQYPGNQHDCSGQSFHSSCSNLPASDLLRRRELQEKPKIGTVQKARRMFADASGCNTQPGTDFSSHKQLQPS